MGDPKFQSYSKKGGGGSSNFSALYISLKTFVISPIVVLLVTFVS